MTDFGNVAVVQRDSADTLHCLAFGLCCAACLKEEWLKLHHENKNSTASLCNTALWKGGIIWPELPGYLTRLYLGKTQETNNFSRTTGKSTLNINSQRNSSSMVLNFFHLWIKYRIEISGNLGEHFLPLQKHPYLPSSLLNNLKISQQAQLYSNVTFLLAAPFLWLLFPVAALFQNNFLWLVLCDEAWFAWKAIWSKAGSVWHRAASSHSCYPIFIKMYKAVMKNTPFQVVRLPAVKMQWCQCWIIKW